MRSEKIFKKILNGESSVYAAVEGWQDFLDTNENAIAMLTPTEYDSEMISEGCKAYTVNMESDKAARKAFAADALQYARENGIEPTQSITAQDGDSEVTFLYLPLGIHVVDTAGRARVVVMWDMGWESEITESYNPEEDKAAGAGSEAAANSAEAGNAGTGASGSSTEAGSTGTGALDNSGEAAGTGTGETEKDMLQQESGMIEESSAGENGTDAENAEVESLVASVDTPSHAEEAASKGSSTPVILVVAVVVIVAVAAGVIFLRKKK